MAALFVMLFLVTVDIPTAAYLIAFQTDPIFFLVLASMARDCGQAFCKKSNRNLVLFEEMF
jgi:hypothetical protein